MRRIAYWGLAAAGAMAIGAVAAKDEASLLSMKFGVKTFFNMEPGGCLRGPLTFFDEDGSVMFRLGAGVDYPSGCMTDGR